MADTSRGIDEPSTNSVKNNRYNRESGCKDGKIRNAADVQVVNVRGEEVIKEKQPWKFIYQNIRALVSENSRRKIDYFNEYVLENKIIIMNFTETWLSNNIQEEANINGYNIFRGDRKYFKQGGTAIYLQDKIESNLIASYSKNKCEMVAIKVLSLNLVNIVTYRPPHTKMLDFKPLMNKVEEVLNGLEKPDPTIIWSGDFNFPFVQWKECLSGGCTWDFNTSINASADEREQFRCLMNLCCNFNLIQIIDKPTRGNNILDLVFTNELDVFSSTEISQSALSDHYFIDLTTTFKTNIINETTNNFNGNEGLRKLNFFSNKIKWEAINTELNSINWKELFKDKNTFECTTILNKKINEICMKYIPMKGADEGKKKIPKVRKKLLGRLKMLKRGKKRAFSKKKKEELEQKILETEKQLMESRRIEKIEKEKAIVQNLPKNPKLLFSYAKRENNRRKEIGPFKKDGKMVHSGEEIGSMLVQEYKKQLLEKSNNMGLELNEEIMNINENDLADIMFTENDFFKAIEKLKENSGPGPDEIPALFLINTSKEIVKPLLIILRKSIDNGEIPDIYKMAHITPIFKGGNKSKFKPDSYRPVSLTSHIMKMFERIISKNIIVHLIRNELFNKNQHGFVPGKSTQTQLLLYYKDIYETLQEGKKIDTVFLDFARAFDKVEHEILMQKIAKHKFKGKIAI